MKKKLYLLAQTCDVIPLKDLIKKAFGKDMFLIPGQVSVQGAIESTIPGRIDGNVRGDVRTEGTLVIGKGASIRGNIHATDLVHYGKVHGDIFVTNKAVISNKAYVKGDVTALVLEVEQDAVIEGAIRKHPTDADHVVPEQVEEEEVKPEEKDDEEKASSWF
ncbi:bactofilin family protein [Chitinophaga rhizophila]|uniref:Polymer-forming cytoskeletal protein n=1 Tax=Chitinophaga rhizophila TaxID=2866212 RepID=A0ABS7GHZ7_9BACT|nr:polymer-forming cytoskeletal protein [Chitinophaga rhizophila]MBW8686941.1 polymer-forming cytoskeletal protein [Chitinophaga rhizophila]